MITSRHLELCDVILRISTSDKLMEEREAPVIITVRDGAVISTRLSTLTSKDRTSVLATRAAEVVPTGGRLQLKEISSRCAHGASRRPSRALKRRRRALSY